MNALKDILCPIERGDGRRTAVEVHNVLQRLILNGELVPGAVLSQVEVAKSLNVSRTPVREAMRMLQEGGLLTGEPNYRSKVVGFDPVDIEALYMKRIVLETLGVTITTKSMNAQLIDEMQSVASELESDDAHGDFEVWLSLHRRLHRLIVIGGGESMASDLEQLEKRSERYQAAYKGAHLPGWWQRGEAEHRALIEVMCDRNVARASELAARHLARTALELLAALAPDYDTSRLRLTLKFAISGAVAA